jgi:hypothetical protein
LHQQRFLTPGTLIALQQTLLADILPCRGRREQRGKCVGILKSRLMPCPDKG